MGRRGVGATTTDECATDQTELGEIYGKRAAIGKDEEWTGDRQIRCWLPSDKDVCYRLLVLEC